MTKSLPILEVCKDFLRHSEVTKSLPILEVCKDFLRHSEVAKPLSTLDVGEDFSRHSEQSEESISKSISNVKDSSVTSFPQNDDLGFCFANDSSSPLPLTEGALRAGEGLSRHSDVAKPLSLLDVGEDFPRHSEQSEESISNSFSNVKDSSVTSFPRNDEKKAAFILAEAFSSHPTGSRKVAFTLAEVLITLGIIGVVAAMTLPNLIANHQKKVTINQLKAAFQMFSEVIL